RRCEDAVQVDCGLCTVPPGGAAHLDRVGAGVRVTRERELVVPYVVLPRVAPDPVRIAHQPGFEAAIFQDVHSIRHGGNHGEAKTQKRNNRAIHAVLRYLLKWTSPSSLVGFLPPSD